MRWASISVAFGCLLVAQDVPTFEVASFKRVPQGTGAAVHEITPISLTIRNASLGNLIRWAYGYEHFRVVGPDWRERPTEVIYDISAKTAGPVSASEIDAMLQALLKERLALSFHYEQRELPVFALVVDGNGPKFKESPSTGEMSVQPCEGYSCLKFERISMQEFASRMDQPITSLHVVDETGHSGVYDFTLDLSDYVLDATTGKPILDARGAIDEEAALLPALPRQLGLGLRRKTVAMQVMVIDHVAKDPAPN
jgi:uncharacterized protein (TIGR03435 family)